LVEIATVLYGNMNTFKVLICVVFTSAIKCLGESEPVSPCSSFLSLQTCAKRARYCQWSFAGVCESVLPCALEINQDACLLNTWNCQWIGQRCSISAQVEAKHGEERCSSFDAEDSCVLLRQCIWRDLKCTRRPNIVMTVAESLGHFDVEWRNSRARNPVLNAMRKFGISLDRHYSARNTAPARASYLTGKHNWRMGLQDDLNLMPVHGIRCAIPADKQDFLPYLLKQGGSYETYAFGKWGLGHHNDGKIPTRKGFDTFIGYYGPQVNEATDGKPRFWGDRCVCAIGVHGKARCDNHLDSQTICVTVRDFANMTTEDKVHRTISAEAIAKYPSDSSDIFAAQQFAESIITRNYDRPFFAYVASSKASPMDGEGISRFQEPLRVNNYYNNVDLLKTCGIKVGSARLDALANIGVLDEAQRIIIQALDRVSELDSTILVFLTTAGQF
jgi:hypothetical protein